MNENNVIKEEEVIITSQDEQIINENTEVKGEQQQTEKPKTRRKRPAKTEEEQITIEVSTPSQQEKEKELESLRTELESMRQEKNKLEEEKTALNETISKLQQEVKITPQKLGQAIKELGISPLSVSRENPNSMTIERYTAMTDSERREWQRSHRSDFLKMMHTVKLS